MKLSLAQQRALMRTITPAKRAECRMVCKSCRMRGDGLGSILKKIAKTLGPVGKVLGPVVLKELVLPMIKKRYAGSGLVLAGQRGRGLRRM